MNKRTLDEDALRKLAGEVRPYLTEKRYAHTRAVEREAARLGEIYLPERVNALRASALLHDITKKESVEKQLQLCREFGIITSVALQLFHCIRMESIPLVKMIIVFILESFYL